MEARSVLGNEGVRRLSQARTVAMIGIAFGLLAFWLSIPPWTVHAVGVPLAVGIVGAVFGLAAAARDGGRLGVWGIGAAVAGTLGALWIQSQEAGTVEAVLTAGLLASTLRFATPLAFAAVGGIISERSGVVNIGLEGMMLMGAFFGVWGSVWSGSWVVGILMAMLFGGLLALVHAVFTIHLLADQIVSGFAVNLLALGLTGFLFSSIYPVRYAAVIVSGMLAALGGAFLSIGFVGTFAENMTSGRGFIALAAVIFGKWRPGWAFAATLLFGFGFALSIPLQREADVSSSLLATLPYVLTLVAVAGLIGRSIPPAAIGRPYRKQ